MRHDADFIFGREAVRLGFVTETQLNECLHLQSDEFEEFGRQHFIGELLYRKGYVTEQQVAEVLKTQAGKLLAEEDFLYGQTVIRNGMATPQQVEECLAYQKTLRVPMRVGRILRDRGYITEQQHRAAIWAQKRMLKKLRKQNEEAAKQMSEQDTPTVKDPREEFTPTVKIPESPDGKTLPASDLPLTNFYGGHAAGSERTKILSASDLPLTGGGAGDGLPSFIGRFEIAEKIGEGGMGVVYRARDPQLNREVAIKMIKPEAVDAEMLKRFERECRAAAKLHHPNIVAIHEVGKFKGAPFYVMDYVGGEALNKITHRMNLIPARAALRVIRDAACAVSHAHQQGILHRDIKPANILIRGTKQTTDPRLSDTSLSLHAGSFSDFDVFLADFGLARDVTAESRLTLTGHLLGTPLYMSPEQIEQQEVGPASDQYSLGAVLYELLTGRPPFIADTIPAMLRQVVSRDPVPPRKLVPEIPRDVETIVLKTLEKSPERRYGSAKEFADDIERFLKGEAILAQSASFFYKLRKRAARNKPAAAAICLLAAAFLYGLFTFFFPSFVRVETTPPGAAVFLDGKLQRQATPATIIAWPPGYHTLELRLDGYEPSSQGIETKAGRTVTLSRELVCDHGFVCVHVSPVGAVIKFIRGGKVVAETKAVGGSSNCREEFGVRSSQM